MSVGKKKRELRIGDPEREDALRLLGEHLATRRLDVHEYDERCARLAAAQVRSDILAEFDDLPEPHPPAVPVPEPVRSRAEHPLLLGGIAAAVVLFAIITKQIWLVVVLVVVGVLWFTRERG